ncbi:response regulator [Methylomonas montana]|uniref:response regulator n=1 Tax=Methylomonas montana TaxID=3058963 RepID=UPI00265B4431|nr:response regulator [Methylomonas montana]WKJ88673.1 response regulator [Methylomonas montana]
MTLDIKLFEILLLEDEPADAHLVRISLRDARVHCRLHHVLDGREGVDFLHRKPPYQDAPRPDLILLDLNMPRMNGREFLAAIKAEEALCDIPVVVLTTSEVERDVEASFKNGASGYITKPVDIEQFTAAIAQLSDYWFVLTRLPRENK